VCPSVDPTKFPNLAPHNHRDTSPLDTRYNCIAYAAADQKRWYWPDVMGNGYWPPGVPRLETLDAFKALYATFGYTICSDGLVENGFEKVAIYALGGTPTHAARQLKTGKWTSKLGQAEDIEHDTPSVIDGPSYGSAVIFMKRKVENPAI
jgi:hypothetical protein